jgi:hypothetical protein
VRTCKLGTRRSEEETTWLERYRQLWDARFDELDRVVEELKRKEKIDGRKRRYRLVFGHDASKEALDNVLVAMEGAMHETLEQLDELVVSLGASLGRS